MPLSLTQADQFTFRITGMSCASCVERIEKLVAKVEGVRAVSVNLSTERARVEVSAVKSDRAVQDSQLIAQEVIQAVEKAGYTCELLVKGKEVVSVALPASSAELLLASLLTLPLILPMLVDFFSRIVFEYPVHWMVPGPHQILLATPVQFWFGRRFYVNGFRAVRAGAPSMDVLVALGTTAAYLLSLFLVISNPLTMELYFEGSSSIICLVLFGKWLESRAKKSSLEALGALKALLPEVAEVKVGNDWKQVPLSEIKLGQIVLVRAGSRISIDGVIVAGDAQLDQSFLTGESVSVEKTVGDRVFSGSLNLDGHLEIEVTVRPQDATIHQMIEIVEEAQMKKIPIQRLVDSISGKFVVVILVLSVLTFFGWLIVGLGIQVALLRAVAVLVIACPCALGLATPTALLVGTGIAAKLGILIQDPAALEIAHQIKWVAFDKTGTLTLGQPKLVEFFSHLNQQDRLEVMSLAVAFQRKGSHPLSKAIATGLESGKWGNIDLEHLPEVTDFQVLSGRGLKASYPGFPNNPSIPNFPGRQIIFGSEKLMRESHISLENYATQIKSWDNQNCSLSFMAQTEPSPQCLGIFGLNDEVRPEAVTAVRALKFMGKEVVMISGDRESVAQSVAKSMGIEHVYAEVLPLDKGRLIAELRVKFKSKGAMVGDGINDAPALVEADLGIAVSSGTDLAIQSAKIVLLNGNPMLVAKAIRLSEATLRKIKQNLFWAFIYNICGIPMAAFGILSPSIAGAAMALSSVSVMLSSLHLRKEV